MANVCVVVHTGLHSEHEGGRAQLEKNPHCRGLVLFGNEFGALYSCQIATGDYHFQYSEYHVLQYNDQNSALANMIVSDGVSPSPKHNNFSTCTVFG